MQEQIKVYVVTYTNAIEFTTVERVYQNKKDAINYCEEKNKNTNGYWEYTEMYIRFS